MCAIVAPERVAEFLAVCERWDVLATVLGEVTATGRLEVDWHGERIVDVPPRTVAHDGPVYTRPIRRPADQDALAADGPDRLPRPDDLRALLLRMVASPGLCSRAWVTEQYDRYVQGNTVLAQPEDAGVVRIDEATGRGVAIATDGNGRYTRLDPYAGAQLALAEAYRNVAATGAEPIAVTNCLNFGSPEDPGVMWQFSEAVRGLADGCRELGTPVTGGNVSFYNQTGDTPILPTPVVGVLGVLDDVRRRTPMGFADPGDVVVLLGATGPHFGGSEWAFAEHGHLGGTPPPVDLAAERALARVLRATPLRSAHDLSDGGLAQALVECCLRRGRGATVAADGDPFVALFSESTARALVSVAEDDLDQLTALAEQHGVPCVVLGEVTDQPALTVVDVLSVPLAELRAAAESTLPALFD
jgi:phosphoribosylformylglycinamidine synthase